ncbi:CoA-transferase family III domain-containing protein [Podospora fimiseda]|uniref:CoA-transferase family III domain-containing protein n=1 Tax=Podospora fimiseda TaxID=252190 RepID=A0AAN7H181_9PEZI|nr:CoA-transferase family III domain-containing protein [Podospora fimiseda]
METTTTTMVAAPAALLRLEKQWRGSKTKNSRREGNVNLSQQTILLSSALRYCRQQLETLRMDARHVARSSKSTHPYSVIQGSRVALDSLLDLCRTAIPRDFVPLARNVKIASTSGNGDQIHFPSPLKEQDLTAAIKALEACAVGAIANLRYGTARRTVTVDLDKISGFLMSAYLTTIGGMDKQDVRVKEKIPDTDLNRAQSILYRRLSANLYSTKNPGEYYHIHGSLDASTTLQMLGLPKENPKLTDYRECINTIEKAVMKHTAADLDKLNTEHRQAGIQAYTWEQFQNLPHGKALTQLPPFTVTRNITDPSTPPVPFDPISSANPNEPRYALKGIKVLEMCRIIAGPTIGRSLAAHGAQVIKVTSPNLPDVPFFQVDVNTGKHTIHLDLRNPADRAEFDALLTDADVLIDGYRPDALKRLGYGPDSLARLATKRNKGFVYVAEDCFGGTDSGLKTAEWASRPGWQQIADCVTGVAWAQGKFMGLDEPVVPPFPMSDYGTGALGCLATLSGLYKRATLGGSWNCRTSLCQYDVFLLGLGLLPEGEQARLKKLYQEGDQNGFFGLRHSDSVDEVGRRALKRMREVAPFLFLGDKMMHEGWSEGFGGMVRWPKEAIEVEGLKVGHVRCARPNGWDNSKKNGQKSGGGWGKWEEDVIR